LGPPAEHGAEVAKDGEIVALLEKKGLPNTILRRSNGTTLYFTRDLALADYKWKKYGFSLSFYATAAEQNLHFKQVFAFLEMLGRPFAANCGHVGFGLITLPEGKMSTRLGRVVLLEDVLNEAVGAARGEVESRLGQLEERMGRKYSNADIDEIAKQVGTGSLKFAVLRVSPEKGIMFDFKKMVSFDGDTGAYLQYTFVRAANILKKAQALKGEKDSGEGAAVEWETEEKRVARTISIYPRIVTDSAKSFKPHILCDYLLRLAADFSSFYEKCPVLKSEGAARERRLEIVRAVETVLGNGLALLGITALQKM
jgi:arginyl-tRNA synthetase